MRAASSPTFGTLLAKLVFLRFQAIQVFVLVVVETNHCSMMNWSQGPLPFELVESRVQRDPRAKVERGGRKDVRRCRLCVLTSKWSFFEKISSNFCSLLASRLCLITRKAITQKETQGSKNPRIPGVSQVSGVLGHQEEELQEFRSQLTPSVLDVPGAGSPKAEVSGALEITEVSGIPGYLRSFWNISSFRSSIDFQGYQEFYGVPSVSGVTGVSGV